MCNKRKYVKRGCKKAYTHNTLFLECIQDWCPADVMTVTISQIETSIIFIALWWVTDGINTGKYTCIQHCPGHSSPYLSILMHYRSRGCYQGSRVTTIWAAWYVLSASSRTLLTCLYYNYSVIMMDIMGVMLKVCYNVPSVAVRHGVFQTLFALTIKMKRNW